MTTKRSFPRFAGAVFFAAVVIEVSFSQVNFKTVGRYQYAQFDGVWYTVVQGKQGDLVDSRHLIVRLRGKADITTFDFTSTALPLLKNVRGRFADGFYELEIPNGIDPFQVAQSLQSTRQFEEVLLNVFLRVDGTPNDPQYNNQWNLSKVTMSSAWDVTSGSSNVIVAVIDVGADYNHEDLRANRWSGIGYDFYDNDSDPYPSDNARHGTAVAGILGAVTNNSLGVAGVAGGWGGVGGIRVMHLDAGFRDSNGDEFIGLSAASQATDSAAAWGSLVINMSFGGGAFSPLESAINRGVINYGVVVIASAGNYVEGQSTAVRYPAAYSNVIAVGATIETDNRKTLNDNSGEPNWGSCYGPELDVVAPGIHVRTTDLTGSIGYDPGNYYAYFNGTSAAAPHVAGLVGLIRSVDPSATWQEVQGTIRQSADKVSGMGGQNFHNEYGYGRINADKAVRNLYVPQVYSTLERAASVATSGQTIVVASGLLTVNNNVTIPTGVSLEVLPGATLSFSGYHKLRIEGTLTANGSLGNPITFQGSGWPGSWFGIEFYNGYFGHSLSDCIIKDASYGLNFINTPESFSRLTIRDNTYGVNCTNYSDVGFNSTAFQTNSWGVYADATSVPSLGMPTGYNSFRWSDYYDIYSSYGGTIWARGNWWGACPPFPLVTPNVDYSEWLCVDPNPLGRPPDTGLFASKVPSNTSSASTEVETGSVAQNPGMNEVDAAYRLYLDGKYQEALQVFENVVTNYPENFAARRALVFMERTLEKLGRSGEILSRLNAASTAYTGKSVGKLAEARRTYEYIKRGQYQDAVTQALHVVEQDNDTTLVKFGLYDLGSIYWYYIGDTKNGAQYFSQLISQFPNDPLSHSAQVTMGGEAVPANQGTQTSVSVSNAGFDLQNYPNPFNPTTTISYTIQIPGRVVLKVYDILGRTVSTLVDGEQQAGQHLVRFDANALASGVYFYELIAPGITRVQKMMVQK